MHKAIKIPTLRHPEQTGKFNTDSMLKKKNTTNNNNSILPPRR